MSQAQDLRVIVAGGGIVGLTAAVALRHAGAEVVVCEQAEQIRAAGTSIGIWQNAIDVFDELGIADDIQAQGTPSAMKFRHASGEWMQTPGFDDSDREYLLIERGRLTTALADAVGHEHIRVSSRFISYEEHEDRVVARFADGSTLEGDLLIGADGAYSAVREQLVPGSEPQRHAGHEVWRALVPDSPVAFDEDVIVIGYNQTNGGYLRSVGNGVLWLVTRFNAPPDLPGTKKQQALAMARNLDDGGWNGKLFEIIEATPEDDILRPAIMIVPPLPTWRSDRVVLMGDAAHAMSPHITAGATLGIGDARALTRCLSDADGLPDALATYEADRIPHYEHVNKLSKTVELSASPEEFAHNYVTFSHWMLNEPRSKGLVAL
jgi:2-polyprenyl-6-methoxyphenol hydroxylase-like FAD-dependent oxidoreductase